MRRLLVAVVLLVGVLVVADFSAAAAAESTVSRQMRDRLGLPEDPSVQVNGFSFLAQAATGRYGSVDVTMKRLPVGTLHTREIQLRMHDVRASFSDLAGSGPARIRVTDAQAVVTIGKGDVMRMLPAGTTDLDISTVDANAIDDAVRDGGDPTLRSTDPRNVARLTATTPVAGVPRTVQVLAVMQITGDGLIRITPRDVRTPGGKPGELPDPVVAAVTKAYSLVIDPGRLPFRVTPTALKVDEDGGLELSGQVRDLVVGEGTANSQG